MVERIYNNRKYYIADEKFYNDFFHIESVSIDNPEDIKIESDFMSYGECQKLFFSKDFFK